jgi:IS30 family transposase
VADMRLTAEEWAEITIGLDRDESYAVVTCELGRPTSTVSRVVEGNGGREGTGRCVLRGGAPVMRGQARPTMFEVDVQLAARGTAGLDCKDTPMTIALTEGIGVEMIYRAASANGSRELRAGLGCHSRRRRRGRKHRTEGEGRTPARWESTDRSACGRRPPTTGKKSDISKGSDHRPGRRLGRDHPHRPGHQLQPPRKPSRRPISSKVVAHRTRRRWGVCRDDDAGGLGAMASVEGE